MQTFIQDANNFNLKNGALTYRLTPRYVEFVQREKSLALVFYMIFRDEHSLIIAACWDHTFDSMQIDDEDDIKNIGDTYPTIAQLIRNTLGKRYSQGALVQMEDFDDGEPKWFVVSVAGNLNLRSADDLFQERIVQVLSIVLDKSTTALLEIQNNKPSYTGTILRGLKKGFMIGLKASIKQSLTHGLADFFDSPMDTDQPVAPDRLIHQKTFEQFVQAIAGERQRRGMN